MAGDTNVEFNCGYEFSQKAYDINATLLVGKGKVSKRYPGKVFHKDLLFEILM